LNLLWTARGWAQYRFWQENDPVVVDRINMILDDTLRRPFAGLGKPEPLKGQLAGWWSRRITVEHRLVYRCIGMGDDQRIGVAGCRYHY
jgi:toxin YoeB